jgi:hypothetical protein
MPVPPWEVVPVPILLLEAPAPMLPASDVVAESPGFAMLLVLLSALLGAVLPTCAKAALARPSEKARVSAMRDGRTQSVLMLVIS